MQFLYRIDDVKAELLRLYGDATARTEGQPTNAQRERALGEVAGLELAIQTVDVAERCVQTGGPVELRPMSEIAS